MPDVFTVHEFWNIFDINRQAKVELVLKLCMTVSQITQQDDSQMLDWRSTLLFGKGSLLFWPSINDSHMAQFNQGRERQFINGFIYCTMEDLLLFLLILCLLDKSEFSYHGPRQ